MTVQSVVLAEAHRVKGISELLFCPKSLECRKLSTLLTAPRLPIGEEQDRSISLGVLTSIINESDCLPESNEAVSASRFVQSIDKLRCFLLAGLVHVSERENVVEITFIGHDVKSVNWPHD